MVMKVLTVTEQSMPHILFSFPIRGLEINYGLISFFLIFNKALSVIDKVSISCQAVSMCFFQLLSTVLLAGL